jgi:hypothetical protein
MHGIQLAISCKKLVQLAILAVAVFIRFWKVLAVACLAVRFCTITVGHSGSDEKRLNNILSSHVSFSTPIAALNIKNAQ